MPMTVFTLTNVPNSLRGDLTKWLQEISTGVYVGNINSRVREELWKRVIDNIRNGQATLSYAKRNEIGYEFMVYNTNREVIYCDGIPLVFLPKEIKPHDEYKLGFSNAAKYKKMKRSNKSEKRNSSLETKKYLIVDIETTGTKLGKDQIIEVAALKVEDTGNVLFHELVNIKQELPQNIIELTGITDKMIEEAGKDLDNVLAEFLKFSENTILVGYNVKFDVDFLNHELKKRDKKRLMNETLCLMKETKRREKLLRDYKLKTVLEKYDIDTKNLHRAYTDVKVEYELALKLNIF